MFSTPLICCSMGVTTVEATTSALAPGYCPETLMMGGAISGYCATGRRANDTAPTITKTIETTAAKMGRSMKKCEIRIGRPTSVGRSLGGSSLRSCLLVLGRHLLPRPRPHQAVDDDAIIGRYAILYDAQFVDHLAQPHEALARDIVFVNDIDELAHLLGTDGRIGKHDPLVRGRARHLHASKHAGREQPVGVGKFCAPADRAGRAVDDVVDELHPAGVGEVVLVEELQSHGHAAAPGDVRPALPRQPLVTQERRLVEGELQADGIG